MCRWHVNGHPREKSAKPGGSGLVYMALAAQLSQKPVYTTLGPLFVPFSRRHAMVPLKKTLRERPKQDPFQTSYDIPERNCREGGSQIMRAIFFCLGLCGGGVYFHFADYSPYNL